MNREKIVPGIIFIGIGLLFLLRNMGVIHWWTLGSLWRFWPLILVIIGINTIFHRYTAVSVISWILFFAVLIGVGVSSPQSIPLGPLTQIGDTHRTPLVIEKTAQVEEGVLNIQSGAMQLTLTGTEESLFRASGFPVQPDYQVRQSSSGNRYDITLSTDSTSWLNRRNESFDGRLELNRQVNWEINAKLGAVSARFDLTDVPFREVGIEVGAGDITLLLDQQEEDADITVNAGASQVTLTFPENINARIHARNVLSQTDISSRYWQREGDTYYSRDYDENSPKLDITVKMGVGRLEVNNR